MRISAVASLRVMWHCLVCAADVFGLHTVVIVGSWHERDKATHLKLSPDVYIIQPISRSLTGLGTQKCFAESGSPAAAYWINLSRKYEVR